MPADNAFTDAAARLVAVPFRLLSRRTVAVPRRALILQPSDRQRVLLTTSLLAALAEAHPNARFDWAVKADARPLIATNPGVAEIVDSGLVGEAGGAWGEVRAFAGQLREMEYDSCFIPNGSSVLAWVAWRAGIAQRIGLSAGGRGFSHTTAVKTEATHWRDQALALAAALGVMATPPPAFFPTDEQRAAVTQRLAAWGWEGKRPLILLECISSGAGWPAERFARVANQLGREHSAHLVLLGPLAGDAAGLAAVPVVRPDPQPSEGEIGALAELARLTVGSTDVFAQLAAAVGSPVVMLGGEPWRSPVSGGAPLEILESGPEQQLDVATVTSTANRLLTRT